MADGTKNDHYNGQNLTASGIIVIVTNSISLYNAVELLLLIFVTFKRWGGLYFWSLFTASFGIIPYSLGYVVVYFLLTKSYAGLIINNIGWMMMITGQSFVLYSRLHLVLNDARILWAVRAMIIVDAIIFHIPTSILNFCANYDDSPFAAAAGYKVYEKIQMTGFCIQEFIISGLYVWKTVELVNVVSTGDARRTMWQLFSINLIIIAMDLALLIIEYRDLRIYEQVFKGVFYSVKVKLEYAILGKLVQLAKGNSGAKGSSLGERDNETLDFVDRSKSRSDSQPSGERTKSVPSWGHIEKAEVREGRLGQADKSDGDQITQGGRDPSAQVWNSSSTSSDVREEDLDDSGADMYATAMRSISRKS